MPKRFYIEVFLLIATVFGVAALIKWLKKQEQQNGRK